MSREAAIKAVGIILSSYPSANREGIENFYKLAVESLSEFPAPILDFMAHPKLGIQTKSTFIPSIAEMRKFCHEEWANRRRIEAMELQDSRERLRAPPTSPEQAAQQREWVIKQFKELQNDLRAKGGAENNRPTMTKEEYQAKLERDLEIMAERAKTDPPPPISAELRKLLNLP